MARKGTPTQLPGFKVLSADSQQLFRVLTREYRIADSGGVQVLLSGLRSLDEAITCERRIEADGRLVVDRFGQPRCHPLASMARDHRAAWQSALRQLNLSIGEPPKVGRPEGA